MQEETLLEEKTPATPKPAPIDVEQAQREIIFEPNPGPQTDFLASTEQEVLYGGAAGGGKSYAMVADPVRYLNNPNARMLLVRRSTEELRELISVSKQLYPKAIPGIKFMERDKTWVAPSGATLWMSYLDRDDDVMRYQGQAFNWIGFDELTQWPTPYPWNYMRSRLRSTKASGLPLYMRATSNPGGPGHQWVKKTFIDPERHNHSFWATDTDTGEVITWPKGHSREENPCLNGGLFLQHSLITLTLLKTECMKLTCCLYLSTNVDNLLEGDWDINEGAAFPEFSRRIHVVEPFEIPHSWPRLEHVTMVMVRILVSYGLQ